MQPKDQILARMYVVLTIISMIPVLVAFQVFRVSFIEGDELRQRGEVQASSYIDLPAMRGSIYDAAGRALAVNVERWDITLDPTVDGFDEVSGAFFERLSKITRENRSTLVRRMQRRSSPQYVVMARDLTLNRSDVDALNAVPGVSAEQRFSRRYNYQMAASHILGHVNTDVRGVEGLEFQYDDILKGIPGRQAARRDRSRTRKLIPGGAIQEPQHGENLVLTIDMVRQTILEEELARGVTEARAKWGAAIAMDPHTGAILAMANVPTYDPNRYGDFSSDSKRNHAVTDQIEPGSTFKLIPATAALETDVIQLSDSVETGNGILYQYGYTLRDTHPHGTITFADVIRLSSNIGTALVAEQMDPDALYKYARQFGFGQRTWIDLPGEADGVVKKPDTWSRSTVSAMSRGYEISATPLQMLLAYSSLANGGLLVHPYIVQKRTDVTGRVLWEAEQDSIRRAFRSETVRKLLPAFEAVVDSGTATAAQLEGIRVAGKTGTAWKTGPKGYIPGAYRATFVGFFPADDPKVAMIVVMDEPKKSIYGGVVSAPVFANTARRWLPTMPEIGHRLREEVTVAVDSMAAIPDVRGMPTEVASRMLMSLGLRPDTDDAAGDIAEQDPGPGTKALLRVPVHLASIREDPHPESTTESDNIMPDLKGLAARDALAWLSERGVRVRMQGHGAVTAQWPTAGASLPETVSLTLN